MDKRKRLSEKEVISLLAYKLEISEELLTSTYLSFFFLEAADEWRIYMGGGEIYCIGNEGIRKEIQTR
jgi:hypothetical protein